MMRTRLLLSCLALLSMTTSASANDYFFGSGGNQAPGGITPPTLVSPATFQAGAVFGGHTVHGDCATDDTAALQSAITAGDLNVAAGCYEITGNVIWPSSRHVQCAHDSAFKPLAYFKNETSGQWIMNDWDGTNYDSIYYCGFRGPNYNKGSQPVFSSNAEAFIREQIGGSTMTTNAQIVGNDFNGVGGFLAAVYITAGGSSTIGNDGTFIGYNTFEYCGYNAVQEGGTSNSRVVFNTMSDCSIDLEADVGTWLFIGNVIDHNTMTFTFGVGDVQPNGGSGFNGLTCGNVGTVDYSKNVCQNNVLLGTHASGICATTACVNNGQTPAKYYNNTCAVVGGVSNCTFDHYANQ